MINIRNYILLLLFALYFVNLIHADEIPTGCKVALQLDFGNQSSDNPIGVEQNWKSLSAIGLLFSSVLISLIYMIAKALNSPSLAARAKTDLIQVVVTATFLVSLYAILSFICTLDAREFGFNFSSFFDGANNYFEYSRNYALNSYLSASNSIMLITGLSSFSINNPVFINFGNFFKVGIYFKPFAGYGIVIGAINWFASLVLLPYSLITGFLVVLNSIQVYFLNLLLPAGVVLRCFSPTRDFGGILIAISLGMFLFYPILFSFSYMIIGEPNPNIGTPDMNWEGKINTAVAKALFISSIPFGNVISILNSLNSDGGDAIDSINNAYASVGPALVYIYILPAINWIILASIIRELSRALGQEVDISGLARMI